MICFLIIVTIWAIAGLIGAWRYHQGTLREKYMLNGYEYKRHSDEEILSMILFYFISSVGGIVLLYLYETTSKNSCWYHNCKDM